VHNTVGIIHRDIKPENLLISEDDTLKVSDFGISKIMENGDDLLDTNAGTKLYLAPETWKGLFLYFTGLNNFYRKKLPWKTSRYLGCRRNFILFSHRKISFPWVLSR